MVEVIVKNSKELLLKEDDDLFNKFNLIPNRIIDKGMCGDIVLALGKEGVRRVVKKFNLLDEDRYYQNRKAFNTEVKFMKRFDHPFLMKLLLVGECREYQAICMQFYHRRTLDYYVEELSLHLAERCVTQVACALRYMHKKNVAHLDVKLDNIFMDADFNAVLGDFGIARQLLPQQKTLQRIHCGGTRCYCGPELFGASLLKLLDPFKMDSYSLGVVLWSLVMRRDPGDNIDYDMEAREKQYLPPIIRYWLLELLERDPSKRPTVTDILTTVRDHSSYRIVIDAY